ncbi:MAG: TadE/TadG family type IV pilus assembly protein [Alphaproteobacteria bacterium]
MRNFWKDERGASAVEFAFIAPLLLLFTIGIIDLGRMGFANSTIKHVAVDGARFASARGADKTTVATESEIIDYVKDRAAAMIQDELTVSVVWAPNNSRGSTVTVQVDYQYDPLALGFLPFGPFQFRGVSTQTVS